MPSRGCVALLCAEHWLTLLPSFSVCVCCFAYHQASYCLCIPSPNRVWASLCREQRIAVLHVVWSCTCPLSSTGADVVVNGSPPHSHGVHSNKPKKSLVTWRAASPLGPTRPQYWKMPAPPKLTMLHNVHHPLPFSMGTRVRRDMKQRADEASLVDVTHSFDEWLSVVVGARYSLGLAMVIAVGLWSGSS